MGPESTGGGSRDVTSDRISGGASAARGSSLESPFTRAATSVQGAEDIFLPESNGHTFSGLGTLAASPAGFPTVPRSPGANRFPTYEFGERVVSDPSDASPFTRLRGTVCGSSLYSSNAQRSAHRVTKSRVVKSFTFGCDATLLA